MESKEYEITEIKEFKFLNETRWTGKVKLPGYPRGKTIIVFHVGEQLIGIDAFCPHEGCTLKEGTFLDQYTIQCPAHHNIYNLRALKNYNIVERDHLFYVKLNK